MNWLVFAIMAWIAAGLEVGFRPALQLGNLAVAPSFLLILVVFVALWARPLALMGSAVALGVVLDMINQLPTAKGETAVILGPWALGCLLTAYTVLNFRALMFRKNPFALAFLCVVGGAIANIFVVAVLALRAFYDPIVIESASSDLWQRLASALYTGLAALLLGQPLQWLAPWLGFKKPMNVAPNFR